MRRLLLILPLLLLSLGLPARADTPTIEDYAEYDPQVRCSATSKPGTRVLAAWVVRQYGGGSGPFLRPCGSGGVSEHKEGRAFDWSLDATRPADRQRAQRMLQALFATDAAGNPHARARRMGVMYLIWNDRIHAAHDGFRARPYLSSGCPSLARCSKTLRHRDHMHVSLSRRGGWGLTSWYVGRLPLAQ